MAKYTLLGANYTRKPDFQQAYLDEFRGVELSVWFEPDDLIDEVMAASPWIPDEWIDDLYAYKVEPGTTDPEFPERKAEMVVVWIKLKDRTLIRLGGKGIMQTRHGAFSAWMRECVRDDTRAEHEPYRKAGGYRCAYDGRWHKGVADLEIDHVYEFSDMLRDFLAEYTGKPGATVEDIEFAHPDDEMRVKDAFLPYHRGLAALQPMCHPHNQQKERERRAAHGRTS